MLVFGPVPSRRLGRSLGINRRNTAPIPLPSGSDKSHGNSAPCFYSPEAIFDAVKQYLEKLKTRKETVDYLTFVPDGEPTLDAGLVKSIELLRGLNIKIAVISNASLIWQPKVREMLQLADWVSLKVDSVDASVWRRINRPCEGLELDNILSGMLEFATDFKGMLATETMLLEGINTDNDSVEQLTAFLQKPAPDKFYPVLPTRPPADSSVRAAGAETLNRIYQCVSRIMPDVELLSGYEGDAFASTGNFAEDLLAITAVHPLRKNAAVKLLGKTGQDWSAVQQLLDSGKLRGIEYQGNYFYIRIH